MADAQREATRRRFLAWSTSLVSDVLGDVGQPAQALSPGLAGGVPSTRTVAGWATTVLGAVDTERRGPDMVKAGAIDAMRPGTFAVWAGTDAQDVCLFGDLLATAQRARGVVGAIVDGGVRDSATIRGLGFPVWARYVTPRASTGVWRASAAQVPVELPGTLGTRVRVAPGDLVVADADGVVVVPASALDEVVRRCEELTSREDDIRAQVEQGASLAALLEKHGRI